MSPDLRSSDLLLNGVRTKPGRDLELREMRPPLIDPRRRHPSSTSTRAAKQVEQSYGHDALARMHGPERPKLPWARH